MSAENVEVVRRLVAAFNRADWDAFLANAAPEFVLDLSHAVGPFQGTYDVAQIRAFLDDFAGMWETVRIHADELRPSGDRVLGTWTLHAHGRDGMEVTSTVTWLLTLDDGRLTRATMYQERAEALAAAGLSGEE